MQGAYALIVGAAIKIFPLAGFVFAAIQARKARAAVAAFVALIVVLALPLLVISPRELLQQYEWWLGVEAGDARDLVARPVDRRRPVDAEHAPLALLPREAGNHPGLRRTGHGADDDRVEEDAQLGLLLLDLVGPVGESQPAERSLNRFPGADRGTELTPSEGAANNVGANIRRPRKEHR